MGPVVTTQPGHSCQQVARHGLGHGKGRPEYGVLRSGLPTREEPRGLAQFSQPGFSGREAIMTHHSALRLALLAAAEEIQGSGLASAPEPAGSHYVVAGCGSRALADTLRDAGAARDQIKSDAGTQGICVYITGPFPGCAEGAC